MTGVLTVDDAAAGPLDRRYTLPAGAAEALTDPDSPAHVLPMARMVCGLGKHLDELVSAYRTGGGVSWAQFGQDVREGQAGANRPLFLGELPRELPAVDPGDRRGAETGRFASPTSDAGTAGRRSAWR